MGRKVIAGEAERADPDLSYEIDDTERIEDGAARTTPERSVRHHWQGGEGFDRCVNGGNWDDAVRRFWFGARKHVPWHPNSILGF